MTLTDGDETENPFLDAEVVETSAVRYLANYMKALYIAENINPENVEDYEEDLFSSEYIKEGLAEKKDQSLVKVLIRTFNLNVLKPERRVLWKCILCRMTESRGFGDCVLSKPDVFNDALVSCFGSTEMQTEELPMPSFVDKTHRSAHHLTNKGKISVARVLTCFSYHHPQVQYCPQLYNLTAILRHYLSEADTYAVVTNIASSQMLTYIQQTKLQHEVSWRTAYELCQKVSKKYISFLQEESTSEELEGLFQQWTWWFFDWLPFPHVVRILDSFLVEGEKILYRASFALISIFTRKIKTKKSGWDGSIKKRGLQGAFIHFCREIPVLPSKLLDKCFRYRNFRSSTLAKIKMKIEAEVKSEGLIPTSGSNSSFKNRTESADNFRDLTDIEGIKAVSSTLSGKQLTTMWRWMPERVTMGKPELAYSSNTDGLSLTTFYRKVEQYEPTILAIKTLTGEIFGAYCSSSWYQRSVKDDKGLRQVFFGSGEMFLFSFSERLSKDGCGVRYPWALGPQAISKVDESTLTKAELHARQLFMCGQHDMICIGGGEGNGIYLDGSLTCGKTEGCLTFNNPPLCKDGDFEVSCIEVFGLMKLDYLG